MDANTPVTVIISAYNEQGSIAACLDSLTVQTYPSIEIIVVDDGSTDETVDVVQRYGVTLLRQEHQGPARARNLGARIASGDILIFLDADQTFPPDFIQKLVEPIGEGETICTDFETEYVSNPSNKWAICWNINNGIPLPRRHPLDMPRQRTALRAVLKSEFLNVGGYDDVGYGEDLTLCPKLGVKAIAAPGAICYHANAESLREVFYEGRWYGKGQQVPKTLKSIWEHTPVWSLKASLRRAWRHRNPCFVIYKIVFGFGVLVGVMQAIASPHKHWK